MGPLLVRHLRAVGTEPRKVLDRGTADASALEEAAALKDGMVQAETDEVGREVEEPASGGPERPVEPGDLVVLAIGVVVAALRAPDLVAPREHGYALGEEEGGQEISLLAAAQGKHLGVVRGAFDAAVRRRVVVGAVAIVLVIALVALLRVGHEIGEGEAVVGRNEIDAG